MNLPQLTAGPLQNSLKGKFCFLSRISVHSIWFLSVEDLRGAKYVSRKTWGRSNDIFLISHVWKMCQKCKCHSYCAWFSDQKESSEGWFERDPTQTAHSVTGMDVFWLLNELLMSACIVFLFQNFLSFSGIFYGSSPLWESAIKVCDVASELLEVSVTQARVPCTAPQLSLARSSVLPSHGTFPSVEGQPLPQQLCLSFCSCASGGFWKVGGTEIETWLLCERLWAWACCFGFFGLSKISYELRN